MQATELTLGVTLAVLGAGLLHAGWNALLKSAPGGDPLLDVGYFLASYPEPGEPRTPTQDLGAASLAPGWPTRAELAERYGVDASRLRWYTVMASWKLAALYEYARRRG